MGSVNIEVPKEVEEQMEPGERLVGYFKSIWGEEIFFTKFGCHTIDGCRNCIYRSNNSYSKENISEIDMSDLEKYEKRFISSFLWN